MMPASSKKRILLVEDDPAILKATRLRLEHEGYQVMTAQDGEEALRPERLERIDLILLDIKLPKRDGLSVLKVLKAHPRWARIPVVVMTASAEYLEKKVDLCFELGIEDWMRKPFSSRDLLDRIHRILGDAPGQAHVA